MHDKARGGDDTLTGGASENNILFGDGSVMDGDALGGDDTLTGGTNPGASFPTANILHGDACSMSGNARGGNDTLTGASPGLNDLFGDARFTEGNARGGDDTLISGIGNDHMWGDAAFINGVAVSPMTDSGTVATGADTFLFAPGNGRDDINDFRQSDGDRIDVSA